MIKTWVENNFNAVLLICAALGFLIPGLEATPKVLPVVFLSIVMVFSCTNISLEELKSISIKDAAFFYVMRFCLMPVLLYVMSVQLVPKYAEAILLLSLMPVGMSSTGIVNTFSGNPTLSLSATVVTNLLTPIHVPLACFVLAGQNVNLDMGEMFITLLFTVVVPIALYFGILRRFEPLKNQLKNNARAANTILIGLVITVVFGLQKQFFMNNITVAIEAFIIGLILYSIYYAIGWLFAAKMNVTDRKTYALCSGINNNALSSAIAFLYFSPVTVVFTVVTEIPWVLAISGFRRFLNGVEKKSVTIK